MNEKVYEDILIDGYNCVMFSDENEFFEKATYYLENEDERMSIVNKSHEHFIKRLTWNYRANEIKKIIDLFL